MMIIALPCSLSCLEFTLLSFSAFASSSNVLVISIWISHHLSLTSQTLFERFSGDWLLVLDDMSLGFTESLYFPF